MSANAMTAYVRVMRGVQVAIYGLPITFSLLSGSNPYLFPPLGSSGHFLIRVACVLIGLIATMPAILNGKRIAVMLVLIAAVGSVYLFVRYASLVEKSVVGIDVPSQHRRIYVTVGSEKTAFSLKYYKDASAADMLRDQGHLDNDVERMWTSNSIQAAHLALLRNYFALLACLNLAAGCLARSTQLVKKPSSVVPSSSIPGCTKTRDRNRG